MEEVSVTQTLIFSADRCTGCKICELTCSMVKSGEYNPQKSYIKLIRNWEMDVNIATLNLKCDFCGKCVEWCPTDAISFVTFEEAAIFRKKNMIGDFPVPWIGCAMGTGN